MPRYGYERKNKVISETEFTSLLSSSDKFQFKGCTVLCYYTGARISELLSLDVDSITISDEAVRILIPNLKQHGKPLDEELWNKCKGTLIRQNQNHRGLTEKYLGRGGIVSKEYKYRTLTLPLTLKYIHHFVRYYEDRLKRIEQGKIRTRKLFGMNRHALNYQLRKARNKSGISDVSFHAFRHGIGTYLAIKGKSAHQISNFLGHTTLNTSQRYIEQSGIIIKDVLGGADI
jgi:integrase